MDSFKLLFIIFIILFTFFFFPSSYKVLVLIIYENSLLSIYKGLLLFNCQITIQLISKLLGFLFLIDYFKKLEIFQEMKTLI